MAFFYHLLEHTLVSCVSLMGVGLPPSFCVFSLDNQSRMVPWMEFVNHWKFVHSYPFFLLLFCRQQLRPCVIFCLFSLVPATCKATREFLQLRGLSFFSSWSRREWLCSRDLPPLWTQGLGSATLGALNPVWGILALNNNYKSEQICLIQSLGV